MTTQFTPRLSLPYPEGTDIPDGPAQLSALALALDDAAVYSQGILSNRPVSTSGTPGIKGRLYYVIGDSTPDNNGITWLDYGTGWTSIAPGSTVGATIAALGTPIDGKVGRLRLGTTPYDFVDVIYDAVYGKWVSADQTVWSAQQASTFAIPTDGSTYEIGAFSLPYKVYTDAGLAPQIRILGHGNNSYGGLSNTINYAVEHADAGVNSASIAAGVGGAPAAQAPTTQGFDTGWVGFTAPGTPKALLIGRINFATINSATADHAFVYGSALLRWVA